MRKPLLLDLFCGAGGAAQGYMDAGFNVIGVDIVEQPRYPATFFLGDAMRVLEGASCWDLSKFDAIHASPPCQRYSVANNIHGNTEHPDLLPEMRGQLEQTGLPWVIENVPGAPMANYVVLCGSMFGLGVKRHRWFETSFMVWNPPLCVPGHPGDWVSVFGHTVLERGHVIGKAKGGGNRIKRRHLGVERGREAMGIGWMTSEELSEAIPPAYTQWIGERMLEQIEVAA